MPETDMLAKCEVNLRLDLEKFRLFQEDRGQFGNLKSAQFRTGLMKTKPIMEWTEQLAWTAVADAHAETLLDMTYATLYVEVTPKQLSCAAATRERAK